MLKVNLMTVPCPQLFSCEHHCADLYFIVLYILPHQLYSPSGYKVYDYSAYSGLATTELIEQWERWVSFPLSDLNPQSVCSHAYAVLYASLHREHTVYRTCTCTRFMCDTLYTHLQIYRGSQHALATIPSKKI